MKATRGSAPRVLLHPAQVAGVMGAGRRMRKGENGEDNDGVCGPPHSCGRLGRSRGPDRRGGLTGRGKAQDGSASAEMEMPLQTGDWVPGAERCILVWHRKGGEGSAGRMDNTHTPSPKSKSTFPLCRCLHPVSCVCILMSDALSVWICIDETVILFPCCPCVQLSTAPTKTH